MATLDVNALLAAARDGVGRYLQNALDRGLIDSQQFRDASAKTLPNLEEWLRDPHIDKLSPNCKRGIAQAIQALLIAYGSTVYLADEPCPYPELTYAIPYLKADIGELVAASHNDYRYNGYKLSCANGSQFDPKERDDMYKNFILNAAFADVKLCPLKDAPKGKLVFFGGAQK